MNEKSGRMGIRALPYWRWFTRLGDLRHPGFSGSLEFLARHTHVRKCLFRFPDKLTADFRSPVLMALKINGILSAARDLLAKVWLSLKPSFSGQGSLCNQ